jgi:hypothetical protein
MALSIVPTVAAADPSVSVLVDGLNNPRGIDVGRNGRIVVAETGAGRVIRVRANGSITTLAGGFPVVTSAEGATGVHNVALTGSGNLFAVVGETTTSHVAGWERLVRIRAHGRTRLVRNIGAYQVTDPDPTDQDVPANPSQSNPYGIDSIGSSRLLVADAGANDLLLVTPRGTKTVARFPATLTPTDHLPFPFPAPEILAEAVPTTVAIGPDGYWYVGQLQGFPFRPGTSSIWRIAPWARGATCDDDSSDGCTRWLTGFTAVVGIEFGRDGSLYVAEMAKNGLFAFFGGDTLSALWHVKGGVRTEIAAGQLHSIGDVAVGRNGTVYVTTGSVFPNNGGAVVAIRP